MDWIAAYAHLRTALPAGARVHTESNPSNAANTFEFEAYDDITTVGGIIGTMHVAVVCADGAVDSVDYLSEPHIGLKLAALGRLMAAEWHRAKRYDPRPTPEMQRTAKGTAPWTG